MTQTQQAIARTAAMVPVDLTRAIQITGPQGEFVAYVGGWGNLNAPAVLELLAAPAMAAALAQIAAILNQPVQHSTVTSDGAARILRADAEQALKVALAALDQAQVRA